MTEAASFTDADFRQTILRSIRLLAVIAALALPLAWWRGGWASAALLAVGAAISGTGLWEWLRIMSAVMARMDAGAEARPMGPVLVGFFLRLALTLAILYVSLKSLDGSVWALAAGLLLGVCALTAEGLRLVMAGTL